MKNHCLLRAQTHCERSVAERSVATFMFIHICMQKRSSVHIASVAYHSVASRNSLIFFDAR